MMLTIYYMFVPTDALITAAREADEEWILEPDVWTDEEYDRTGRRHAQEDVERAAWTFFIAKLVSAGPESERERTFRLKCLELGFEGCWKVYVARAGDPVGHLFEAAEEHRELARQAMEMP